jgi:large exoprotein involved in heme utilization and adhesion
VGQAGNVQVTVEGDAHIEGTKEKDSSGGDIYTGIFGNTWWSGNGGNCEIHADDLSLTNEASIQVGALSTGNAGNATIDVNSLELTDGAFIATSGYFGTGGDAGKLELTANSIFISGPDTSPDPFNLDFTGITAASSPLGGKGGEISILADTLTITNRGSITGISWGPGPGGDIDIDAGSLEVLNGANINASAFGSGPGGMIDISADSILVSGVHPEIYTEGITGKSSIARSAISSQAAQYGGNGGSIQINADSLQILDGAQLTTETFGPGNAGTIQVVADNMLISGVNEDLKNFFAGTGGDPAYAGAGISASSSAAILGDQTTGNCGDVRIAAGRLTVQEGGQITSETATLGKGGYIEVTANDVNLYSNAFISAMSTGSGLTGKAGDISIAAQNGFHSDNGSITTSARQAQGGNIAISAREMQFVNNSLVSAKSSGAGDAGDISIAAQRTFRSDNSSITTSAEQAQGGDIAVAAQSVELLNNSLITAESFGEGDAGDVYLGAADSFLMRNSAVSTEAREADGGNIKINTGYMVHLVDSEITASVGGGSDTVGGNISIDPEYVILKNSRIVANAFEGKGGNIDIASNVFLADPDSVVDASSALGIDGEVDIRAPISSISGSIAPLPKDFRSVLALLREPCMARLQGGKYSSFVVGERDSLPLEPGGVLPSPLPLQ